MYVDAAAHNIWTWVEMQMFVVPWKPARADIKIATLFWYIHGQLSMDACKRCPEVLCYIKTQHDYERTKNFRVVRSWCCSVFVVWTWFNGASANVRCVCSLSSPGLYWEGAVWQLAEKGGQESTGRNVESEEKKFPWWLNPWLRSWRIAHPRHALPAGSCCYLAHLAREVIARAMSTRIKCSHTTNPTRTILLTFLSMIILSTSLI